jgi:hypothetical protein
MSSKTCGYLQNFQNGCFHHNFLNCGRFFNYVGKERSAAATELAVDRRFLSLCRMKADEGPLACSASTSSLTS